jgi:23S rRNA pseudouridine2605 synthase
MGMGDKKRKKPSGRKSDHSKSHSGSKNRSGKKLVIKPPEPTKESIRLNRYIASAGICSRRDADLLISEGKIKVNGEVVTTMGFKVNPKDKVTYNNKDLKPEKLSYVLLNKPKDFITTTEDPQNRKTVMDLVKNASNERIFPVGRLDRPTTGLLLLTNDGELAKKLSHPSSKIRKIYHLTLDKPLTSNDLNTILEGFELDDGPVSVDELAVLSKDKREIGLEIHIGRNRIVRRLFEHFGYKVKKLDRVIYASLTKKNLPRGEWDQEIIRLKHF